MTSPLVRRVRAALEAAGDPAAAPIMQRYMKSTMPYAGVRLPQVRAIAKAILKDVELPDAATWREHVLALWREAKYREERYVAIELALSPRAKKLRDRDALPTYEEMIVTGAWWDFVDEIAQKLVGELLRRHPADMARTMRAWSRSPDPWKRRTSILAQNRFKEATDRALLYDCIAPSLGEKDFFLRKAIGWALRAYAYVDPDEVRRYVRAHEAELSPLSRREAMKHLS